MLFPLADVIHRLERIEGGIPALRRSSRLRYGEHRSVYKNTGYDFHRLVEYDPELHAPRQIAWNVFDVYETLYAREFIETREFPKVVAADCSLSMLFGVFEQIKIKLTLETLGAIGLTCAHDQDPVGLIGFTDRIIMRHLPKAGAGYAYHLVRELYKYFESLSPDAPGAAKTDFHHLFSYLRSAFTRPVTLIIISDFIGGETIARSPLLRGLSAQHDVTFVAVDDPKEFDVRGGGYIRVSGMEEGNSEAVEVSAKALRRKRDEIVRQRAVLREELSLIGVNMVVLEHYGSHFEKLTEHFAERGIRG